MPMESRTGRKTMYAVSTQNIERNAATTAGRSAGSISISVRKNEAMLSEQARASRRDVRIVPLTGAVGNLLERGLDPRSLAIRAARAHRFDRIGDGENRRLGQQLIALERARIAA